MQTWKFVDKTDWQPGPWQDEPDKVQWVDPATDLDCLIVRNATLGILCGYVGVPKTHTLFGVSYEGAGLDVHGGITFSDRCQEHHKEQGICHVPEPGRPAEIWWLGFDCGHAWDASPGMPDGFRMPSETYRDIEFVRTECTSLAVQIAAAAVSETIALTTGIRDAEQAGVLGSVMTIDEAAEHT